MFWFVYKINLENFDGSTPNHLATTLALSHCDNLSFQIVTILYFGIHNIAAKILRATMW